MRTEKDLSRRIRKEWDDTWVQTFEFAGVQTLPDLYCHLALLPPFWVELKAIPTDNCKLPFRPGQPQWLSRHTTLGGRAYILVLLQKSQELVLLRGSRATTLSRLKLREATSWLLMRLPLSATDTLGEVKNAIRVDLATNLR